VPKKKTQKISTLNTEEKGKRKWTFNGKEMSATKYICVPGINFCCDGWGDLRFFSPA
jgi:hypothetical protein